MRWTRFARNAHDVFTRLEHASIKKSKEKVTEKADYYGTNDLFNWFYWNLLQAVSTLSAKQTTKVNNKNKQHFNVALLAAHKLNMQNANCLSV